MRAQVARYPGTRIFRLATAVARNSCALARLAGKNCSGAALAPCRSGGAHMNHEERRRTLMSQHRELRVLVANVRAAALEVLESASDDSVALRNLIGELRSEMEKHLAAEEALLGPVLARIDAWGPVRLDLMRAEHAHQRAVLAVLRSDRAGALSPSVLSRRVLGLLDDILADMDAEDRDLLDARVLRDDLIQLDASDA
jgi:hypothetical protein